MDPRQIIEDGYDRIAPRYEEWSSGPDPARQWFIEEVLTRLAPGSEVLELGCGSGTAAIVLADDRSYTGVDLSAGQLAIASGRLPGVKFVHADLTQISFSDGTFDAVVAFYVFNHVPRVEQAPMFARIFGWLRPGGRLMLSLGASDTDDEIQADWLGVPMFFAGFEPNVNERSLREAGFELDVSEVRSQTEEGEGEARFHWVIASKPVSLGDASFSPPNGQ